MNPMNPMGSGSADQKPKPPEKPPEKPASQDAQRPFDPRSTDKPATPGQDAKGGKDNQNAANPGQGGKTADVPTKQPPGDSGSRPAGDAGKQAGDSGPRHSGDAPAKSADGAGTRAADGSPHSGEPPAARLSYNFAEWKADFTSRWEARSDGRPDSRAAGSTDAKGGPHGDQRSERFSHKLDLDDCRADNGKFDRDKLKAKLEGFAQADRAQHTKDLMRYMGNGPRVDGAGHQQAPRDRGPVVGLGPLHLTVKFENARSWVDVREVDKAMHEVCDKNRVHARVEIPGRPPVDMRPGPVPRPGMNTGSDRAHPRFGPVEPHDPQDGFRPQPVRPTFQTPPQPRGGPNFPHGR